MYYGRPATEGFLDDSKKIEDNAFYFISLKGEIPTLIVGLYAQFYDS